MDDIKKKVIDGLERHMHGLCHNTKGNLCPYWYVQAGCSKELINDTLTVIRSHEAEIKKLNKAIEEKQTHLENLQKVNEELEKRIAIMSDDGWHNAQTDPPKKNGRYFIYDKIRNVYPLEYEVDHEPDDRWGFWEEYWKDGTLEYEGRWTTIHRDADVLYWMQIPEPPKDSEQEAQRDYEKSVEYAQYCERYEPTYNPEDGSM